MKIKQIDYDFTKEVDLRTNEVSLFHKANIIIDNSQGNKFIIIREKEQDLEDVIDYIRSAESVEEVTSKYNAIPQKEVNSSEVNNWCLRDL